MINDNGVLIFAGAISEEKMAMPRLTGPPIAMAKAELISVPIIYGNAPYDSRPSTEFQSVPVKKPKKPSFRNMSLDPLPTEKTTSAIISKV